MEIPSYHHLYSLCNRSISSSDSFLGQAAPKAHFRNLENVQHTNCFDILYAWLPFSHVLASECIHPLIQCNKSWNGFSQRDKREITWNASLALKWWGRLCDYVEGLCIPSSFLSTRGHNYYAAPLGLALHREQVQKALIYKEQCSWNKNFSKQNDWKALFSFPYFLNSILFLVMLKVYND